MWKCHQTDSQLYWSRLVTYSRAWLKTLYTGARQDGSAGSPTGSLGCVSELLAAASCKWIKADTIILIIYCQSARVSVTSHLLSSHLSRDVVAKRKKKKKKCECDLSGWSEDNSPQLVNASFPLFPSHAICVLAKLRWDTVFFFLTPQHFIRCGGETRHPRVGVEWS